MLNSARREALEVVLQKQESVESTCWFWVDYERGSAQSTPSKTVIYFSCAESSHPVGNLTWRRRLKHGNLLELFCDNLFDGRRGVELSEFLGHGLYQLILVVSLEPKLLLDDSATGTTRDKCHQR